MPDAKREALEAILAGEGERWGEVVDSLSDAETSSLMTAASVKACYIQFPEDPTLDEISRYVHEVRERYVPYFDLKILPAEAVIRAALLDPSAVKGVPAVDVMQAQLALVTVVAKDHSLTGASAEEFIQEVLDAV